MLNYTASSWFPAWKFTKSNIHRDYMIGPCKFHGFKDSLTGERIQKFTTVLWNKTLRVNIILDNYFKFRNSTDPLMKEKLSKIELPIDLSIS